SLFSIFEVSTYSVHYRNFGSKPQKLWFQASETLVPSLRNFGSKSQKLWFQALEGLSSVLYTLLS
ncbi:hypothetical protein, partial [Bacteroides thetaiotaomicron]